MNTIGIDWNEVILLVIGALVGICSSVAMIFIQNVNEKYGKMCIYTKFNCLKNMGREGWGIYDNPEGGLTFLIPTIFEIENTSKNNSEITHEEERYYGDTNGSYSFVIEPTSIKRENCVYLYKISYEDTEAMSFDTIALQYFDEKNVLKTYRVRKYAGWQVKNNAVDNDWTYVEHEIKVK